MSNEEAWHALRLRLEALKETVASQVRAYPPPIPACDAQFNHLLAQRRDLTREPARLDLAAQDKTIAIGDFIASSPCEAVLIASQSRSGPGA